MAKKREAPPVEFETVEEYAARVQKAMDAAGSKRVRPPKPMLIGPEELVAEKYSDSNGRRQGEKIVRVRRYSNGVVKRELVKQIRKNAVRTAQNELEKLKQKVADLEKREAG